MGRHTAPESGASVVRMNAARSARARSAPVGAEASGVDFSVAEAVVNDLTLIAADDQLLDRIAAGQGDVFASQDVRRPAGPGVLAPLLATWRADIVDPQWPQAPTVDQAVRAFAAPRTRPARRALRPMLGIAVAISTLLFGSAAIGAQHAQPGDTLWPLARVLYAGHATSVQAGIAASESLDSARNALDHDLPEKAMVALTSASGEVEKVLTTDGKEALQVEVNKLFSQAKSSIQATRASRSGQTNAGDSSPSVLGPATTPDPVSRTRSSGSRKTSNAATTSGTRTSPDRTSTGPATTAPTTPPTSRPIVPPPVVVPSTPTSAPVTSSTTSTSHVPTTSGPGTTSAPPSTDVGTPTTSDQPTTVASTTSELPTPTQLPAAQTGNGLGAQAVPADGVPVGP